MRFFKRHPDLTVAGGIVFLLVGLAALRSYRLRHDWLLIEPPPDVDRCTGDPVDCPPDLGAPFSDWQTLFVCRSEAVCKATLAAARRQPEAKGENMRCIAERDPRAPEPDPTFDRACSPDYYSGEAFRRPGPPPAASRNTHSE